MDFFKAKVCNLLLIKVQNCQSLDLEALAFLFSEENNLWMCLVENFYCSFYTAELLSF